MPAKSPLLQLNKADLIIILKHIGVVAAGAVLVYLVQLIPHINFGVYQPLAVIIGAGMTTIANQLLRGN